MIEILPNALYSRADLIEMFSKINADWDGLRAIIAPRKVIGQAYLGAHILEAFKNAPSSWDRRKKIHVQAIDIPQSLRARRGKPKDTGSQKLIHGFTAKELGILK